MSPHLLFPKIPAFFKTNPGLKADCHKCLGSLCSVVKCLVVSGNGRKGPKDIAPF